MPPAITLHTNYFGQFVEDVVTPKISESWFSDFKKNILKQQESTTPLNSLVTNSTLYLTQWGLANAANAGFNGLDTDDKDIAQATASVFVIMAVVIDMLGTQNGYAAITQRNKYLESLHELVTAIQTGKLTNFELADRVAKCAVDLQAAEALPGWSEFISKIGTDAVAGINSLTQQVNAYIRLAFKQPVSKDLLAGQDNFLSPKANVESIHSQEIPNAGVAAEKIAQPPPVPSSLDIATNSVGLITGLANIFRGIAEIVRLYFTNKFHNTKIKTIDKGVDELNGGVGTEILKHVGKSTKHRKAANFWALLGAIFRIGNGAWGIAAKIVFLVLGAVIAPWIVPLVGAVVLLVYAFKNWMHARHTRLATRLDSLLGSAVQALSIAGNEKYEKHLKPELVKDLKALAQGGKQLWNFLKALGRSDLFAEVKKLLEGKSSFRDRFPLIKKVIDICTTPTEIVRQALNKNKSAIDALAATRISSLHDQNDDESDFRNSSEQEWGDRSHFDNSTSPLELNADEEKVFQKFMSSKLEKAIAASRGQLPGWRFSSGDPKIVKKMSEESIRARVGDTPETTLMLEVLGGLNKNGKTRNSKASTFFSIAIKSRTWNLTKHGKDIEKALGNQDPTQLAAITLINALTTDNAGAIAKCRFKGSEAEQNALANQLKNTNHLEIKTLTKAIDQCDGKLLSSAFKALGERFQPTLKAALMLFGHTEESADHMAKVLGLAEKSTPQAEDLSAALGILTKQRLDAKLKDGGMYTRVRQYLADGPEPFSMPHSNSLLIHPSSPADPRQQRYVDDVVKGKIPLDNVPEFLLNRHLREALKNKPANTTEALREQLHLGFRYQNQGQTPISLSWPTPDFYGKTEQERGDNLMHSLNELLKIDARECNPEEALKAASLYREWDKNHTLSELKSIIKTGGIQTSVALHCITNLAGIPILDETDIDCFGKVENINQIKSICLDLIHRNKLDREALDLKEDTPEIAINTSVNTTLAPDNFDPINFPRPIQNIMNLKHETNQRIRLASIGGY